MTHTVNSVYTVRAVCSVYEKVKGKRQMPEKDNEFGPTLSLRMDPEQQDRINQLLQEKQLVHQYLKKPTFLRELLGFENTGLISLTDRAFLTGDKVGDVQLYCLTTFDGLIKSFMRMSETDQSDLISAIDRIRREAEKRAKHEPNSPGQSGKQYKKVKPPNESSTKEKRKLAPLSKAG